MVTDGTQLFYPSTNFGTIESKYSIKLDTSLTAISKTPDKSAFRHICRLSETGRATH